MADFGKPEDLEHRQRLVHAWRALYEGDINRLRDLHSPPIPEDQKYLHDPLPEAISQSYADYLFSQPPKLTTVQGQEQLDAWLKETDLLNQLVDAHLLVSSEGEIFYRLITDTGTAGVTVEWLTADRCYTTTDGIVIVSDGGKTDKDDQIYELAHHNYTGSQTIITTVMAVENREEWEFLTAVSVYAIDSNEPIIGKVANKRDLLARKPVSDSDYKQSFSLLLALDETTSIGGENANLSAPDMFVFTGELEEVLNASANEDFFVNSSDSIKTQLKNKLKRLTFFKMASSALEDTTTPPIKQIEKKFDAQPIIDWRQELASTIIKRAGLVQQANDDPAGGANSGVAIKLRYMPTENAAESRRRLWAAALVQIVKSAAALSSIPKEFGGIGRGWTVEDVMVEFGNILPTDEDSLINSETIAVAGEIRSRRQAVENINPSWSEEQIMTELERIQSDLNVQTPQL